MRANLEPIQEAERPIIGTVYAVHFEYAFRTNKHAIAFAFAAR
jgi:hypothetical protein